MLLSCHFVPLNTCVVNDEWLKNNVVVCLVWWAKLYGIMWWKYWMMRIVIYGNMTCLRV